MPTPERITRIGDRLAGTVDEFRDTAAAAIADDAAPERELGRVGRRLDQVEDRLGDLLGLVGDRLAAVESDVGGLVGRLERGKRTTWPRRLFWLGVGTLAGSAAAGLFDPDAGTGRRARLADQARSAARGAARDVRARVDHAAGVAKGAVIETTKDALSVETVPADLDTLLQKVRSEAIGPVAGTARVDVEVAPGGTVTLTGTVDDATVRDRLVEEVSAVGGVNTVVDELRTG